MYEDPEILRLIILIIFFTFLLFGFFLEYILNKILLYKIHKKIIYYFIIFSPFIFFFSLYQSTLFVYEFFIKGHFFLITFLFRLIFLCIFIYMYWFIATRPTLTSYWVISEFKNFFKIKDSKEKTFYDLQKSNKNNKFIIVSLLIFAIFYIIILTVFLSYTIILEYSMQEQFLLFFIIYFSLIIFYLLYAIYIKNDPKIGIKESRQKDKRKIQNIIENLSITAGIKTPDLKILNHLQPTVFVLKSPKKYTIYVTTALINLLTKSELEAVLAHEISQILSKNILYYLRIEVLRDLLRFVSYIIFFALLAYFNPLYLGLLIFIVIFTLLPYQDHYEWKEKIEISLAFTIINPVYVIFNFISFLFRYSISATADYWADQKALELTRYPDALITALTKLSNTANILESLPEKYYQLYFTGENTSLISFPSPQPSISERIKRIQQTNPHLKKEKIILKDKRFRCTVCKVFLEPITTKTKYGLKLVIEQCPKCRGIWFDKWDLFQIDLNLALEIDQKNIIKKESKLKHKDSHCPKCRIKIFDYKDINFPKGVKAKYCKSCSGFWLPKGELNKFIVSK